MKARKVLKLKPPFNALVRAVIIIALTIVALAIITFSIISEDAVSAFDPPTQSSDNATEVINWHGDTANVTIIGAVSLEIPSLREDLKAAAVVHASVITVQIANIFKDILGGLIVFVFNYFAYRFKDRWLFVASGFALLLFGFSLWDDYQYLSILLVITGVYNFSKAGFDKGAWEREK